MRHVRTSIEIRAASGVVWTLLAEFRHWPRWGPTVRAVESEAEAVGPGVTGRVKTFAGPWVPFQITEVDVGRSWHWKVAGFSATGHHVVELAGGTTRVEFTVPFVFAPYLVVLRLGLNRLRAIAEDGRR